MRTLLVFSVLSILASRVKCFELTLIHTNDVHAHYEQMNMFGGRCPQTESDKGACSGGTARLATKVQEIRQKEKNVLFLNAGDYFQGTLYYNLYSYNITSVFMNLLKYDAMCLGNHEFDRGVAGLFPFVNLVQFPILACNLDVSNEPTLRGKIGCVQTFNYTVDGKKETIAVVGYITPETETLATPGNTLKFLDEIESLTPVVKKLKESGVNKIIGLGHSGVSKDQEIAAKVPGIDIIVGGHSHTFLYSGTPPSIEKPLGPYPIIVKRTDGSKALVLQAYCFGKYLGYLKVKFDQNGDLDSWQGQPILLDNKTKQDETSLEVLAPYKKGVDEQSTKVVGRTGVLLRGDRLVCRVMECNMGNFLADAMVSHFRLKNFNETGGVALSLALLNSGGIRASIDEKINNGSITMMDVSTVIPFSNTIELVDIPGSGIKTIMEHSVENYDVTGMNPPGGFLQVSGIHVVYDLKQPPNQRVAHLNLLCSECRVPKYFPVNDTQVYRVAIPTYLIQGGDGFSSIKKDAVQILLSGDVDIDIVEEYLQQYNPVFTSVDGRIIFKTETNAASNLKRFKLISLLIIQIIVYKNY